MIEAGVTMAEAAAYAGVGYDCFRKTWRDMVKAQALPAPFRGRPYRWRREALEDWRRAREDLLAAQLKGERPPANENGRTGAPSPAASARGRHRMMERMSR